VVGSKFGWVVAVSAGTERNERMSEPVPTDMLIGKKKKQNKKKTKKFCIRPVPGESLEPSDTPPDRPPVERFQGVVEIIDSFHRRRYITAVNCVG
jgi:hypothetical protein